MISQLTVLSTQLILTLVAALYGAREKKPNQIPAEVDKQHKYTKVSPSMQFSF